MEHPALPPTTSLQPKIKAASRRKTWLQVYLPVGFFVLLMVALAALVGASGGADPGAFADAALVVLIIPALFLGLVALAALAAVIVIVLEAGRRLPEPANQVQIFLRQVSQATRRGSDVSVQPIFVIGGLAAMLRGLISIFRED